MGWSLEGRSGASIADRPGRVALRLLILLAVAGTQAATGLVSLTAPAAAQAAAVLDCGLETGPTRAVASVVDGETVRLDDGRLVRLIGALAPRGEDAGLPPGPGVARARGARSTAVATALWPPAAQTHQALAELVEGKSVSLAFGGPRMDRYGHVLAQLFVARDGVDIWVQGRLVETGQSRAYALPESAACLTGLVTREATARKAGLGLWANAAYQVRPADRPTELMRYRHTFQLVRGSVERTSGSRSRTYLVLTSNEQRAPADTAASPDASRAFRVILTRSLQRQAGIENVGTLVGTSILVRGWIEGRSGPEIALIAAADLTREH